MDTQALVSEKVDDEEEKDGDSVIVDVEFPRVRRFKLNKFLGQFEGTERDLKALFVNYDKKNTSVDFKNLEREVNQNAG